MALSRQEGRQSFGVIHFAEQHICDDVVLQQLRLDRIYINPGTLPGKIDEQNRPVRPISKAPAKALRQLPPVESESSSNRLHEPNRAAVRDLVTAANREFG